MRTNNLISVFHLTLLVIATSGIAQTIKDVDGNIYKTAVIGKQTWMTENLRSTKYANGDRIVNITDSLQWGTLHKDYQKIGAWSFYQNNSKLDKPYGKLYNWFAVEDERQLCPSGWHIPSDSSWQVLIEYLGADSVAGAKMKIKGTQFWKIPNTGASNQSGFNGYPGGFRDDDGSFQQFGNIGFWWSATPISDFFASKNPDTFYAWAARLSSFEARVFRNTFDKKMGLSVRCLKNPKP